MDAKKKKEEEAKGKGKGTDKDKKKKEEEEEKEEDGAPETRESVENGNSNDDVTMIAVDGVERPLNDVRERCISRPDCKRRSAMNSISRV